MKHDEAQAQPAPLGQVERGVGRPVPKRASGRALVLTGDDNTPPMPLTEADVNHMRRLLAWMRCEWMLDEDMQRGYMLGTAATVAHGMQTPEQAGARLVERAEQINKAVPLYVRQAVKMLTKALRDHERKAGIVDNAGVGTGEREPARKRASVPRGGSTPPTRSNALQAGDGYEVLTVSAGSPKPPAWGTGGEQ